MPNNDGFAYVKSKDNRNIEKYFDEASWDEILKGNKRVDVLMSEKQMKKLMKKLGVEIDDEGRLYDTKNKKQIKSNIDDEIKSRDVGAILSCCRIVVDKDIYNFAQYVTKYCR